MNVLKNYFKKYLQKVPAGLMIIPLFMGALVNTFCSPILEIGSYTTAAFSNAGAATVMGIQLVCLGSRLQMHEIGIVAKRGSILLIAKLVAGFAAALLVGRLLNTMEFWGMSLLAIVCAISNTNGSIYLSLMSLYGDEKDATAVPIITINNGPLFPILILGTVGMASFSWIAVLAALLPIVIGMIVGNISKEARDFLNPECRNGWVVAITCCVIIWGWYFLCIRSVSWKKTRICRNSYQCGRCKCGGCSCSDWYD